MQHSAERRAANRRAHIGLLSPKKGRTNIEMMGAERAAELSAKIRNRRLGKVQSAESRAKGSKSLKEMWRKRREEGKVEAIAEKISRALKGKVHLEKRVDIDDRRYIRGIQWREAILTRDLRTCQSCSAQPEEKKLHAHHIKPWEFYPELRYELSNGLTLCNKCHRKIEVQIRKQNSLKLKAIEERLNSPSLGLEDLPDFVNWLQGILNTPEVLKCV